MCMLNTIVEDSNGKQHDVHMSQVEGPGIIFLTGFVQVKPAKKTPCDITLQVVGVIFGYTGVC